MSASLASQLEPQRSIEPVHATTSDDEPLCEVCRGIERRAKTKAGAP